MQEAEEARKRTKAKHILLREKYEEEEEQEEEEIGENDDYEGSS